MYDELVKRLRKVAEEVDNDYDVDPYNAEQRCLAILEAADAIEELSKQLDAKPVGGEKFVDAIIKSYEQSRWIPVTERLPEENVCVLVLGGYFAKVMETAILDDGLFYSAWDNRTEMFGVTHWMPLPEPPKEE